MPKKAIKTAKPAAQPLPPDVIASDLKYPSYENKEQIEYRELQALGLQHSALTFYNTTGLGWILLTLHIAKASRRSSNQTDRSYAIKVDGGGVCRAGAGPHVLNEVTVYLSKSNIERLRKYVDLYKKGLAEAGMVRDRISSRRAEGQVRRANGQSSWRWDS